jgi:hypothetical protein
MIDQKEVAGIDLNQRRAIAVAPHYVGMRCLIPRVDEDGRHTTDGRPLSTRALKRFAYDRFGVEARPPEEVWESARSYVPEVCADVDALSGAASSSTWGPSVDPEL